MVTIETSFSPILKDDEDFIEERQQFVSKYEMFSEMDFFIEYELNNSEYPIDKIYDFVLPLLTETLFILKALADYDIDERELFETIKEYQLNIRSRDKIKTNHMLIDEIEETGPNSSDVCNSEWVQGYLVNEHGEKVIIASVMIATGPILTTLESFLTKKFDAWWDEESKIKALSKYKQLEIEGQQAIEMRFISSTIPWILAKEVNKKLYQNKIRSFPKINELFLPVIQDYGREKGATVLVVIPHANQKKMLIDLYEFKPIPLPGNLIWEDTKNTKCNFKLVAGLDPLYLKL